MINFHAFYCRNFFTAAPPTSKIGPFKKNHAFQKRKRLSIRTYYWCSWTHGLKFRVDVHVQTNPLAINESIFRATLKSIMLTLSTRFRCKLISNAAVSAHHVPGTTYCRLRVQPIWAKQANSHPYYSLSFDHFIYIASGCSLRLSWIASLARSDFKFYFTACSFIT